MRVAILSMQRIVNFGSVLQAWSLRQIVQEIVGAPVDFLDVEDVPALKSCGADLSDADYQVAACYSHHLLHKVKRRAITILSGYNKRLIRNFMRHELRLNPACSNKEYDYVIVGSDEVLNHDKGVRLQLHGAVKQSRSVMTFAASCGSAKAEDVRTEDVPSVQGAMNRFVAVSVRDEGTARYVRRFYSGKIHKHMDPVLMGCLHARPVRKVWLKKYLLVYAYGHRIRKAEEIEAIRAFAKKKGLKTVAIGGSQFWCDLYIPASPMRMLDWFAHADYVVTDTFHGAIFSMIHQKKFAAIVRPSNENKLTGLLDDVKLMHRKMTDPRFLERVLDEPVDYDTGNAILARERVKARHYLEELLINGQEVH